MPAIEPGHFACPVGVAETADDVDVGQREFVAPLLHRLGQHGDAPAVLPLADRGRTHDEDAPPLGATLPAKEVQSLQRLWLRNALAPVLQPRVVDAAREHDSGSVGIRSRGCASPAYSLLVDILPSQEAVVEAAQSVSGVHPGKVAQ